MGSPLVRKLMFLSSWAMAACMGVAVFCMMVFCGVAAGIYDRVLGGKPLPALTEFYLSAHGMRGGYLFVILFLVVATSAFLFQFAASRAKDPLVGVWIWILQVMLLALGTAIYFGMGVVALMLPMVSICSCMTMKAEGSSVAEFFKAVFFGGSVLAAVAYGILVAVLMWRMRPGWEIEKVQAGEISL